MRCYAVLLLAELQAVPPAPATARIVDQAERLTLEQRSSPPRPGADSIAQILTHMLDTQQTWRMRIEAVPTRTIISPDAFPTVAAFRTGWQPERQALDALLAMLDEQDLEPPCHFERRYRAPPRGARLHRSTCHPLPAILTYAPPRFHPP